MMLKLQDENFFRKLVFASSDHVDSTRHPKLEVTYITGVGLNTVEKMNSSVTISPNPFTSQTTLTSTVALAHATVTIVNAVGSNGSGTNRRFRILRLTSSAVNYRPVSTLFR